MDDKNAFERQIAAEIDYEVGPPHPVDALAITRTAKTPTPRWRIQTMFSPAKALTVGAIVFALGGVMLIAQPFDRQSASVPGAATDDPAMSTEPSLDPLAPAHVSGQFIFAGDQTISPTITTEDGVTRYRGGETWTGIRVEASDPRLMGELSSTFDRDVHPGDIGVVWGTMTITNDAGSWTGTFIGPIRREDASVWPVMEQLTGNGAYEGLSAIILQDNRGRFEGVILPGELPGAE